MEVVELRVTPMVIGTSTRERVTLTVPDAMIGLPSVWLDDTTVQLVAFTVDVLQPQVPISAAVYACSVSEGTCQREAELRLPIPVWRLPGWPLVRPALAASHRPPP